MKHNPDVSEPPEIKPIIWIGSVLDELKSFQKKIQEGDCHTKAGN